MILIYMDYDVLVKKKVKSYKIHNGYIMVDDKYIIGVEGGWIHESQIRKQQDDE